MELNTQYLEDVKKRLAKAIKHWDEHPLSNSAKAEVRILKAILEEETKRMEK